MKYYLHDSNSFNDDKITELYINFGYEGLGLFYTILEKIAMQEKPIKTMVLKKQLNVGKKLEKCWNFLESLQLISSNNGETFNKQLLNFSEKYQIKKEKNKEKIRQWRENQIDTEIVTSYEKVRTDPKVNKSKVNKSKVNKSEYFESENFNLIWNLYQKKVGDKLKIEKKISTLGAGEISAILDHIPKYVASTPDPKYRKNLETYLNNKSWNDEIIIENGKSAVNTAQQKYNATGVWDAETVALDAMAKLRARNEAINRSNWANVPNG